MADGMYEKEATHTAEQDEIMEEMPIGYDNFRELRDLGLYYVDKTPP